MGRANILDNLDIKRMAQELSSILKNNELESSEIELISNISFDSDEDAVRKIFDMSSYSAKCTSRTKQELLVATSIINKIISKDA